ncbi:hypothetical protein AcW1_007424 [Taiwanofungus camphoratus]|nr:hypothetical protein AcW2_007516 [Antrodia cinnamomea]KAI0927288.1 hypothetical protein AcV5_007854 [Antrodia cinnamomea]KAI0947106.1 hypothetical protein AcV7_009625 [Antrodia cinnamomea]KAI0953110.1 hypothetical protein AcW1_007424 [Antrodia cinnamomea]
MEECQLNSGNNIYSCFPNSNTTIPQHDWASFVWNSRLPQFTEDNLVNIFLFHADSLQPVLNFTNCVNPSGQAGLVRAEVDDSWFGAQGSNWNGENMSYPFYWVISPSTEALDGSQSSLATFAAVQTTYADSVVASMSSASAASAASASASAASVSAASSRSAAAASSATATSNPSGSGSSGSPSNRQSAGPTSTAVGSTGSVQSAASSTFPHWAIAVIVVLGFLALVASGILAFFITRRMRNRRNSMLSHRGSMNSASPMMANAATGNTPQSPLLGAVAGGMAGASGRPTSPDGHDGASTISRTSDAAPFSGADAAIMAAAFRSALRKPDFANQPGDEGESPDDNTESTRPSGLLSQELAEEGRDIRSVGSSRGVRVETLNSDDDATTVQDNPH